MKPERTPLEANVWGTPKSSGSFMTMFEGRILRALDYAESAFEVRVHAGANKKVGTKLYGLSEPMGCDIADSFQAFQQGKRVYLSCGDSSATDIRTGSVDAIITDPPFFDNVHYSQLADFFHVWQRHILGTAVHADTTRSAAEVQNADASLFTKRLAAVWAECHRVLVAEGVLVFTYHHSREAGWRSVLQALMQANFRLTAAHPVKAEMSVAMPKRQAKEPIDLDIILVCRKRVAGKFQQWNGDLWAVVQPKAEAQVNRLRNHRRKLSRNDVRVIVMAQLITQLSHSRSVESALAILDAVGPETEAVINTIHACPMTTDQLATNRVETRAAINPMRAELNRDRGIGGATDVSSSGFCRMRCRNSRRAAYTPRWAH